MCAEKPLESKPSSPSTIRAALKTEVARTLRRAPEKRGRARAKKRLTRYRVLIYVSQQPVPLQCAQALIISAERQTRNGYFTGSVGMHGVEIIRGVGGVEMSSYRNRENPSLFSHGRLWSLLVALGAFCAFFVLLSPPALAQGAAGSVSGVVRDTSGAVAPGASVTITNTATGVTTRTETNNEGLYFFPYVQPGVYDLTASRPGFQTVKKPGVTVNVTEHVQVSFDLKVGNVEQTVEVTGEAPLLHTADATTGQTIDRMFVNDLPLLNRTALDLAFLAPGIAQAPNSTYGTTTQTSTTSYQGANNFVSKGSRNQTSG